MKRHLFFSSRWHSVPEDNQDLISFVNNAPRLFLQYVNLIIFPHFSPERINKELMNGKDEKNHNNISLKYMAQLSLHRADLT